MKSKQPIFNPKRQAGFVRYVTRYGSLGTRVRQGCGSAELARARGRRRVCVRVPWSIEPRRRIALGSSCTRDHALAMKAGEVVLGPLAFEHRGLYLAQRLLGVGKLAPQRIALGDHGGDVEAADVTLRGRASKNFSAGR